MTPVQFNTRAKRAGLLLPKVGLQPVAALVKLCEAPAAAIPNRVDSNTSPSPIPGVGALITHGLVVFADGSYVATDKGRAYLASLRENNLA